MKATFKVAEKSHGTKGKIVRLNPVSGDFGAGEPHGKISILLPADQDMNVGDEYDIELTKK